MLRHSISDGITRATALPHVHHQLLVASNDINNVNLAHNKTGKVYAGQQELL